MIVKRGILRNSAKSDDCDAARRALGIDRASTSSVNGNTRLELGTIYTENPLHEGQSVVPNSRHDAGDTDSLLTRRIEQKSTARTKGTKSTRARTKSTRARTKSTAARTKSTSSMNRRSMSIVEGPRLLRR